MSSKHGELIAGYLDGGLSPEEADELAQLVARDEEARTQLIETGRLHRQLIAELRAVDLSAGVLEELHRDGERYVERVMGEVRAQPPRRAHARPARGPRRPWRSPLLLAAAIAIAVLLWRGTAAGPAAGAVAAEAHAIGTLRLIQDGGSQLLPPGSALPAAAQVMPAGATDGVVYADGTRIMLGPGSRLSLGRSAAGGKRIDLMQGELSATVAKQPAGRPLLVSTARLLATVVGTSFTMRSAWDSYFAVSSGLVHVRDTARGSEFDLAQGQSLLVRSGAEPLRSTATLWSLAGQWPRVVTAGRPLRDAAGAEQAIGSVAYRPLQVNPYFTPEQYVCVQSGKLIDRERQLFALPAAFRLHLRVRAERAGTALLTMQPPRQEAGVTPNHGSKPFNVDASWREISLGAEDFTPASAPQTLVAGYPIACVSLWGFACGGLELSAFTLESTAP